MDYLNAFTLGVGIIALAVVAWRLRRASKIPPDRPLKTVATYAPKHDGDVPGWER